MSENEKNLESKLRTMLDECLNDCFIVADCEEQIFKFEQPYALSTVYNTILEQSKRAMIRTAKLFAEFIRTEMLPLDSFCMALEEVLEKADNLSGENSKIWQYFAEIIAPLFYESIFTLDNLQPSCEVLISSGHAAKFLGPLFKLIVTQKGADYLLTLWYSSDYIFDDFMPSSDVNEFIKDNKLDFLVRGICPSVPYKDSMISQESSTDCSDDEESNNEDCASSNVCERIVYDKDFVLLLRDNPISKKKSENLLEVVRKENVIFNAARPNQYMVLNPNTQMANSVTNRFTNFSETVSGRENHFKGCKPKAANTLSISAEDVDRILTKMDQQFKPKQPELTWRDIAAMHFGMLSDVDKNPVYVVNHICKHIPATELSQFISEQCKKVLQTGIPGYGRDVTTNVIVWLIRLKAFPLEEYCTILQEILQQSEVLAITPKIWEYLPEIVVPLIYEDILSLKTLLSLVSKDTGVKFFGQLFKFIIEERGSDYLTLIWNKSQLKFEDFIPIDDLDTFVKDNGLEFLVSPTTLSDNPSTLSFNEIYHKLVEFLKAETKYSVVALWITMNVGDRVNDREFIRVLAKAAFKDCTQFTRYPPYLRLTRNYKLLLRYINGNVENECEVLRALRAYTDSEASTTDKFILIFKMLYEDSILSHEGIALWKDSKHTIEQENKVDENILNFDQIYERLLEFFKEQTSISDIISWIGRNVGHQLDNYKFIRVLATALFETSIVEMKLKREVLVTYSTILSHYVHGQLELELQLLYALATHLNKHGHMPELVNEIFLILWQKSALQYDNFLQWSGRITKDEEEEGALLMASAFIEEFVE